MADSSDINQLYKRLQELIDVEDNEQIIKISDKLIQKQQNDPDVLTIKIIALIKTEKYTTLDQVFKKNPPGNDVERQFYYAYYIYKTGKNKECIQFINSLKDAKQLPQFGLLIAQALFKQGDYQQSLDQYFSLISSVENGEDYNDFLVNIISVACANNNVQYSSKVQQLAKQYTDKGDFTRDLVFNLSLLNCSQQRKEEALNMIKKFKSLLDENSAEDKEDLIMAELQQNYIELSQYDLPHEELDKKLKQYEMFSNFNFKENNLKAVVHNNTVSLRGLKKYEQYSDSISKIEDAISGDFKQTQEQQLTFKINKLLLVINKNKLVESLKIIKDIEKNYSSELLNKNRQFILAKIALLYRTKNEKDLETYLQELSSLQKSSGDSQFRMLVFLIQSELCKLNNQQKQIIEHFKVLQENDKSIFENEVICCFIFSILKDKSLLDASKDLLKHIIQNTNNVQILEVIGEMYIKEKEYSVANDIYEKILKSQPNSQRFKLKLAQISAYTDSSKAEKLLEEVEMPEKIEDYNELVQLESEIALSKMKNLKEEKKENVPATKKITKKKKKIRYPKGFDPENPGPLPNPERWIPKCERKANRNKKNATYKKGAQGSSNVGQQEKETFQKGTSTAQKEVTASSTTKGSKKKNKKR